MAARSPRLAIDDLKIEAERLAHARDEFRPIFGAPAGFGGDQAGMGNVPGAHLGPADFKRLESSPDHQLRQPAGLRQAFAEPHDAGKEWTILKPGRSALR